MFPNRGRVSRDGSKVFARSFPEHAHGFPNVEGRAATTWNPVHHIAGFTGEMLPYRDVVSWWFDDGGGLSFIPEKWG